MFDMFRRLDDLERHFEEIERYMLEPSVVNDPQQYTKLMKEQAELRPVVETYRQYRNAKQNETDALELLQSENDEDLRAMAKEEIAEAKEKEEALSSKLKSLLLPTDPNDDQNIVLEIRAGVGGDEAALFAAELYRMYMAYADSRHWRTELVSVNETGIGGFKEVVFIVNGKGAYSRLKYESGVHRVQRVPETESGGRIHTSTATVAVMPELEDVDVDINPADIRMEVYRSSGAGGQHINKTSSAVRLIHEPSGIVVACQEERSQLQNREKAMRVLRAKLYEIALQEQQSSAAAEKRSQVGTGDRSEKIRTYNFPQGRVTDHRINLTLYSLDKVLNGNLDEILDALITADQAARLAKLEESA